MIFPSKFFVTGTDTGVGKTFVSAVLALGLKAHYWKPIQSGTLEGSDTDWIKEKTGLPDDRFLPETVRLTQPLSPHAAAVLDGAEIDLSSFRLPLRAPYHRLVVEGAGGLLVPINSECMVADLISQLGLPAVVVARSGLGTINHTVLTVQELRRREIPVVGVVMNGARNESNRQAIEHYAGAPVIAQIEPQRMVTRDTLLSVFEQCFAEALEASLR